MKKLLLTVVLAMFIFVGCAPASTEKHIIFTDAGWDSAKIHNNIAGFIAENAFGMTWSELPGSTPITYEAIKNGEIDLHMEMWTDNIPLYKDDVASGAVLELGVNFDDNMQGFYVPRYVIEGDASRGIEPMAPNLKFVADLLNYADVFVDDENPSMGRVYGAIPGWAADDIMYKKYEYLELDEKFVYFRPGSDAALAAAFTGAYERGEPIVGYYWEPTWLMGKYDFVLLEDAPFNPTDFLQGKTAFDSVRVTITTRPEFDTDHPEYTAFLRRYKTSSALTSAALTYMQDTGADYKATALWFLKNHDYLLDEWLDADKAAAVREALK
ncbi:MAG: ABC transporter substrate-binding protein [Erysipelothrix sp.]|nr:ABC transporter substrate-binding protein [Erysipelothrix sp.]